MVYFKCISRTNNRFIDLKLEFLNSKLEKRQKIIKN